MTAPRLIGPRFNGAQRAPVSLAADEIQAVVGYRYALRAWKEAQREEQRTVNENRSQYALATAHVRARAATDALSKALETLQAALSED